jgi:transcriptional accessory protein Tex/SPT6
MGEKDSIAPMRVDAGADDDEDDGVIEALSNQNKNRGGFYDEDEDDLDDFIVDDAPDGEEEGGAARPKTQKKRFPVTASRKMFVGPTQDEIQESMDIFGIDNLDDLLGDEDEEEEEGEGEDAMDTDGRRSVKGRAGLDSSRSLVGKFDRQLLVDGFYTDADDAIRIVDIPERLIAIAPKELSEKDKEDGKRLLPGERFALTESQRNEEAKWCAGKLVEVLARAERLATGGMSSATPSVEDLLSSVEYVLCYLQKENLEIQFIWAYRRDYLHEAITRKHLWLIMTWDEKWHTLLHLKQRILDDVKIISDAAAETEEDDYESVAVDELKGECDRLKSQITEQEIEVLRLKAQQKDTLDDDDATREAEKDLLALEAELASKVVEFETRNKKLTNEQMAKLRSARYNRARACELQNLWPSQVYLPQIVQGTDEQTLQDYCDFLTLLMRAAEEDESKRKNEGWGKQHLAGDVEGKDGKKDIESERSRLRKLAGEDHHGYLRYRRVCPYFVPELDEDGNEKTFTLLIPVDKANPYGEKTLVTKNQLRMVWQESDKDERLRKLVDSVVVPAATYGSGLVIDYGTYPNDPPASSADDLSSMIIESGLVSDDYGFKTTKDVTEALKVIIAAEYSAEPRVLQRFREFFLTSATISTEPTEVGRSQITPFNELFGLHWLQNKSVRELLEPEYADERTTFLRLLQAEQDGLINITFKLRWGDAYVGSRINPIWTSQVKSTSIVTVIQVASTENIFHGAYLDLDEYSLSARVIKINKEKNEVSVKTTMLLQKDDGTYITCAPGHKEFIGTLEYRDKCEKRKDRGLIPEKTPQDDEVACFLVQSGSVLINAREFFGKFIDGIIQVVSNHSCFTVESISNVAYAATCKKIFEDKIWNEFKEDKREREKKLKDFLIEVDSETNTVTTNQLDVMTESTLKVGDIVEFNSPGRLDKTVLENFVYGFIQRAVVYEDRATRTIPIADPEVGGELMLTGADLFCENFLPRLPEEYDQFPDSRQQLDAVRKDALYSMFVDHLWPKLEEECRRELVRVGKEAIVEEATDNFEKLLALGPVRAKAYSEHNREAEREYLKETLLSCPNRPKYPTVAVLYLLDGQPFVMVYLDRTGEVRAHEVVPQRALGNKSGMIKKFIRENLPEVIVLNASGGYASKSTHNSLERNLIEEMKRDIDQDARQKRQRRVEEGGMGWNDYADEEDLDAIKEYRPNILILNDDLAKIFMTSPRAKKLMPDYNEVVCAAVCLGRYAQEPLCEYANIWTTANSSGLFGHEVLYLNLHPLQALAKSATSDLMRSLENVLCNAVCDHGVDINEAVAHEHRSARLAFVAGLGLRKADDLKRLVSEKFGSVLSRHMLLNKKILKPKVYENCAGFLRVKDVSDGAEDYNPLDDTRIHPSSYMVDPHAHQMIADALELETTVVPGEQYQRVEQIRGQIRQTLEKRLKSTRWLDLWLDKGRPICGVTKYSEVVKGNASNNFVPYDKEKNGELEDCLFVLELDQYAEELSQQARNSVPPQDKRFKMMFRGIKEELRFPWLDLRKPLQAPSISELFTILTGETDNTLHVGLRLGCTVEKVEVIPDDGGGRPRQKAFLRADNGLRCTISAYDVVEDRSMVDSLDLKAVFPVGFHSEFTVINVKKMYQSVDVTYKPSYNGLRDPKTGLLKLKDPKALCVPELAGLDEGFWIENASTDTYAKRWFEEVKGVKSTRLFSANFRLDLALESYRRDMKKKIKMLAAIESAKDNRKKLSRPVVHPLWQNKNWADLEDFMRDTPDEAGKFRLDQSKDRVLPNLNFPGSCLMRPSSNRDKDFISVAWLCDPTQKIVQFNFTERGRRDGGGLGDEFSYSQAIKMGPLLKAHYDDTFSDLDEIHARFIEPMNHYVRDMVNFNHFEKGLLDKRAVTVFLMLRWRDNKDKAEAKRGADPTLKCTADPPFCITFNTKTFFDAVKNPEIRKKWLEASASERKKLEQPFVQEFYSFNLKWAKRLEFGELNDLTIITTGDQVNSIDITVTPEVCFAPFSLLWSGWLLLTPRPLSPTLFLLLRRVSASTEDCTKSPARSFTNSISLCDRALGRRRRSLQQRGASNRLVSRRPCRSHRPRPCILSPWEEATPPATPPATLPATGLEATVGPRATARPTRLRCPWGVATTVAEAAATNEVFFLV